jgi:hypothetical protein
MIINDSYDTQNLRICPDVGIPLSACQLPLPLFVAKIAEAIAGEVKMSQTRHIEVGAKV